MNKKVAKFGMTPSHPGDFVQLGYLDELGLTTAQAAEILGVSPETLASFLARETPVSPELALRLEKAFGADMDLMLRMQAWYDTVQMRKRADEINVQPYNPA